MNKYFIEQINVSDDQYKVIALSNSNTVVEKNELLFSYESSKANYDVYSERQGRVYINPNIIIGLEYIVGTLVAVMSENELSESELHELFNSQLENNNKTTNASSELIITNKAKSLIEKFNLDISLFEGNSVINEDIVLSKIKNFKFNDAYQDISFYYNASNLLPLLPKHKKLAIIGAGKAALQIVDTVFAANNHLVVIFYDSNPNLENKTLLNCPIKCTLDINIIKNDFNNGLFDEIIVSFSGDIQSRKQIFESLLKNDLPIANVVHPTAIISSFTQIGVGNIFFANTRIGPFCKIGDNNVVSSYCSIEHHNSLGSHNTFGPSVIFSGSCSIGDQNKFGTGIFIEPNVKIGCGCIISSGVVLTMNIPDRKLVRNLNKTELRDL